MVQDEEGPIPPPVLWAQRANTIFLTFCLEDCTNVDIDFQPSKVYFKGIGGSEKKLHELTINLFKEIDPLKSTKEIRDRNIEVVLKKVEENGPYWPHLTKEKTKMHWLKVDFNRWQDEDTSDDDLPGGGNDDLEEMMRTMGGLGGGDNKPSFDDIDVGSDSDDEDLPDLVD